MAEKNHDPSNGSKKTSRFSLSAVKAYFKTDKKAPHKEAKYRKERLQRRKDETTETQPYTTGLSLYRSGKESVAMTSTDLLFKSQTKNENFSDFKNLDQNGKENVPDSKDKIFISKQASPGLSPGLLHGRAFFDNIVYGIGVTADNDFDFEETVAAVTELSVPELVRKAEVGDLILDKISLEKMKERFLLMSRLHKRQFYLCGEQYIIPEQIARWSDDCKKLKREDTLMDLIQGDNVLNSKVALIHGDIVTLEVDAVVSAGNNVLTEWHSGVSKGIYRAATALIYYELESVTTVDVGEVAVTAGYLLPAKYIFHTAGPMAGDFNIEENLTRCYRNCLDMMVKMELRTIAFCCISTGAKKLDMNHAARIALTTVKQWLLINMLKVDKIIFCVYDIGNWACYQRWMPAVFPPGKDELSDDNATDQNNVIPVEILRMDRNSIELYKRALSEGKEAVYNIRIMVVGHYGVGKTTLTKRLFGEDVDINTRESTNGIDVHVKRCRVSLETGQWITIDEDKKADSVCHRLVNLLKNPVYTDKAIDVMENNGTKEEVIEHFDAFDGFTPIESICQDTTNVNEDVCSVDVENVVSEQKPNLTLAPLEVENIAKELFSLEDAKEENILYHLKDLIEDVRQSASSNDSNMADVSIWDFAGQYVFYATHQVFLSRRAVYLLVTDISKHVEDIVKDDDCFLDSKGVKHWKISEFVDFWLNSIHEFCGSSDNREPPVLLVGTFADKIKQEPKEETIDEFFYALRSLLVDKVTSSHLIEEDFAIDNTIKDGNIDLLKRQILKTASAQSYWGELIPAKWITLENSIASLKNKGSKVLHKDMLRRLNDTLPVPIETEDELELFLRFHHESGNILYYSDENLSNTIVLDPQWLIDAFKSLITAKMFCCRKPNIFKKWIQFDQSAILTRELIDAIWGQKENSQFNELKDLLLNYLEKLGFIAKPQELPEITDATDYYFAPCVLKCQPPEDLFTQLESKNTRSTSKLCVTTELRFLPSAVFNKLLAACISKWPLSKSNAKHLIFCGCAVFDLEGNHTLYLYFYDHVIQIWLTKLSTLNEEPSSFLCSQVYSFVLDMLANNLHLSGNLQVLFKCQCSEHNSNENMFSENELSKKAEIVCSCRTQKHVIQTSELTKYWQSTKEDNCVGLLTDKDINRIAQNIGKEYESLALELGLSQAEMDHINMDSKTAVERIRRMLLRWRDKMKTEASLDILTAAMKSVGIDSTIVLESTLRPLQIS